MSIRYPPILLFALMLSIPLQSQALLYFICITMILTLGLYKPKDLSSILLVMIIIPLVSLVATDYSNGTRSILRDLYYLTKPIVVVFAAVALFYSYKDKRRILNDFINCSIAIGFIQLLMFVNAYASQGISNIDLLRTEVGRGVYILSFFLGFFFIKNRLLLSLKQATILIVIGLVLLFLSMSRLSILFFLVGLAASFLVNGKVKLSTVFIWALSALLFFVLFYFASNVYSDNWLISKIASIYSELGTLDFKNAEKVDIVHNWRSYESYLLLDRLSTSSVFYNIFGLGAGSSIYLDGTFNLSTGEEIESAPILHNGILYLVMKSGIFGAGLYLYLIFIMYKKVVLIKENTTLKNLCFGLVTCVFLSSFVITGIYNAIQVPVILFAFVLLYKSIKFEKKNV
ncbi:hypothetical protein [Vibrio sp. CyArs1]|uniref:hypothetical protein n=1 Tax=Vibrio sp. CyArs1 TaxID=2682577 RepID=UPI001F051603|nr:hypothetical protein [Vibrio sp. CyArs1]